jgi:hypothetical protein
MIEYAQLLKQHKALQKDAEKILQQFNYMNKAQRLLIETNKEQQNTIEDLLHQREIFRDYTNKLLTSTEGAHLETKMLRVRDNKLVRWNQRYFSVIIIMFVIILFLLAMVLFG